MSINFQYRGFIWRIPVISFRVAKKNVFHFHHRSYSSATNAAPAVATDTKKQGFIIDPSLLRNIAIIAHVDHGKTTLVDCLLKQSGTSVEMQAERVMDSNDLEKERGITILSKCTSILYNKHRINIVDTPGHADFGGEVERVLSMVDGVVLVVDATEGPMTQTKFVLSKALKRNFQPLVVINKADRDTAQFDKVDNDLFDLFASLNATDEQMEYPIIYTSAKAGWATTDMKKPTKNMNTLFEHILSHFKPPNVNRDAPFSLLVTQMDSNPYLGKCFLGKVQSGIIRTGSKIKSITPSGNIRSEGKVAKLFYRRGLEEIPVDEAAAGDIVSIAGLDLSTVNDTIADPSVENPLPSNPIDPPTVSMTFSVNDSPLAGREGKYLTSSMIRERLHKEGETNIALSITDVGDAIEVRGRGELQLGILIETLRREGFELSISPPRVLFKWGKDKKKFLEPIEEVIIDVDHEYTGVVIEKLSKRKGELKSYDESGDKARLHFLCPTRGLLSYNPEFKNDTHGTGTLNHVFFEYQHYKGEIEKTRKGALLATSSGEATPYALSLIEPRGKLFITPKCLVYPGMVIGENSKESDLEVNAARAKQQTNIRAAGKDDQIKLTPVKPMSLEQVISFINDDEIMEATPSTIRLRKRELDSSKRKQGKKSRDFVIEDE